MALEFVIIGVPKEKTNDIYMYLVYDQWASRVSDRDSQLTWFATTSDWRIWFPDDYDVSDIIVKEVSVEV